jgi:hypothetical protein
MIDFDEAECSTLITVTVDELHREWDGAIHVESSLKGGVGQYIHYVGYCWSKDLNVDPVKDSNSIYIPYSSIVKSTIDINGDGKIDQQDFFSDGGMIERTYSTDIQLDLTGVNLIFVRAFVSFNDSLAIYSSKAFLDL